MNAPEEVLKALTHVKTLFPEVTTVVFNKFGQWSYMTDNFEQPKFDDRVDKSILEYASDSVIELPAVFQLPF